MRKLRVFESISVDGYFTDARGDMGFAHAGRQDPEFAAWASKNASGGVAAQLGEAGLVDEYQFVIIPVALGAGRTVFTKGSPLRLVEQRAFACGNVAVTYAV